MKNGNKITTHSAEVKGKEENHLNRKSGIFNKSSASLNNNSFDTFLLHRLQVQPNLAAYLGLAGKDLTTENTRKACRTALINQVAAPLRNPKTIASTFTPNTSSIG